MCCRRLIASLLTLCSLLSAAFTQAEELRVCQHATEKYAYRIDLANLILERTTDSYSELQILPSNAPDPTQERCLSMLREGLVDLAYVPPTTERLQEFDMLTYDVQNGMLGFRVLLIHKANAGRFSEISNLDDLRQMRGGFGSQWGDFPLFARNRLPVEGVANADNLLPMLNKRRFDYFHRGLHEAWRELDLHRASYPDLMVEPRLLLVYNLPVYFTFNRNDSQLQKRFAKGLARIQADGSLRALFLHHYGKLLKDTHLQQRTRIVLDAPLPPGLPPIDTSLWLSQ